MACAGPSAAGRGESSSVSKVHFIHGGINSMPTYAIPGAGRFDLTYCRLIRAPAGWFDFCLAMLSARGEVVASLTLRLTLADAHLSRERTAAAKPWPASLIHTRGAASRRVLASSGFVPAWQIVQALPVRPSDSRTKLRPSLMESCTARCSLTGASSVAGERGP
jgi:hypothetical protein